jgi:hypothetical protein
MEENGAAAFQKGPRALDHEPEAKEKQKISAEASEAQKTHEGGSKMGGNYSDGFCAASPSNNRAVHFDA